MYMNTRKPLALTIVLTSLGSLQGTANCYTGRF